jgi:ABC-type multidrug transport system fused ATPase/permease subunit
MCYSAVGTKPFTRMRGWLGWRIISLLGKHRGTVIGLAFLIVVASLLDLAVPFLTRGLIDKILRSLQSKPSDSLHTLFVAGLGILGATASTRLLRSFYNYRLVHAASHVEDEVKTAAFGNFLRLDTQYHSGVNTGEVVGALDRGGTAVFIVLYEILGQNLVPPLLVVAGVLTSLALKNPWMAAIVFLPLPAYVLSIGRLGPRMHETENQVSKAFERVTKESYDIASNVRVVKKFGQEEQERKLQRSLLRSARWEHYRAERLWALVDNTQSFIATAGRVGVIVFGGYLVLTRQCTVGDYVLFISMQDMVYGPISQLSIILPKLRRTVSRAERMFEILDEQRGISDAPNAKVITGAEHSLEFRNLSFRYPGKERWTLSNVNFTVPAGSTVALIGLSGSGKSTLMNLLQRLYDPQEGAILIDGQDIRDVTVQSLRDLISVVPQEVELFSRSIAANIAYGQDQLADGAVERAARVAQAHEFVMRCEKGYDTQVGERGLKLSGGERQRIGIARAIVRDPKILILDEATSHLDNESERLIQVAMEKVTRGRTCFIIAHRLSTVRNADIVVVFAESGVEAVGTYEELWRISPTFRKLNGIHVAEKPRATVKVELEAEDEELMETAVGL